jgi:hypothetical protein
MVVLVGGGALVEVGAACLAGGASVGEVRGRPALVVVACVVEALAVVACVVEALAVVACEVIAWVVVVVAWATGDVCWVMVGVAVVAWGVAWGVAGVVVAMAAVRRS